MSNTYEERTIRNLMDFYDLISNFENSSLQDGKRILRSVYRGVQENPGEVHLIPSLEWSKLTKYEYELVKEMQRIKPFAFDSLKSLELIEKLQHYGMPTRLLDFSLSPYIALYFAIRGKSTNKKHRIYCMKARESDVVAETIARISTSLQPFMFYEGGQFNSDIKPIEEILFPNLSPELKNARTREFLIKIFSKNSGFVFTYPKYYTERESNQQSFFLMFCNEIYDKFNNVDCCNNDFTDKIKDEPNILNRFYFKSKIYNPFQYCDSSKYEIINIDPNVIEELKYQLNKIGVNENMLFSDSLEKVASSITDSIKIKYKLY